MKDNTNESILADQFCSLVSGLKAFYEEAAQNAETPDLQPRLDALLVEALRWRLSTQLDRSENDDPPFE